MFCACVYIEIYNIHVQYLTVENQPQGYVWDLPFSPCLYSYSCVWGGASSERKNVNKDTIFSKHHRPISQDSS